MPQGMLGQQHVKQAHKEEMPRMYVDSKGKLRYPTKTADQREKERVARETTGFVPTSTVTQRKGETINTVTLTQQQAFSDGLIVWVKSGWSVKHLPKAREYDTRIGCYTGNWVEDQIDIIKGDPRETHKSLKTARQQVKRWRLSDDGKYVNGDAEQVPPHVLEAARMYQKQMQMRKREAVK